MAPINFLSVLNLFPRTNIRCHKRCNFILGVLVFQFTELVQLTPSTAAMSPCCNVSLLTLTKALTFLHFLKLRGLRDSLSFYILNIDIANMWLQ